MKTSSAATLERPSTSLRIVAVVQNRTRPGQGPQPRGLNASHLASSDTVLVVPSVDIAVVR
jgi:hypothetical protein